MFQFKDNILVFLFLECCLLWIAAAQTQPLNCPLFAGVPGTPGHNGLPGREGKDGPPGQKGERGISVAGPPGKKGPAGDIGPPGAKGSKGDRGLPGQNSPPGRDGAKGEDGASGTKGQKGEQGLSVTGPTGKVGPPGPVGPSGSKGQKGDQGPLGHNGSPGKDGLAGPKGQKGEAATEENSVIRSLRAEIQRLQTRLNAIEKASSFQIFKKVGHKYYASKGQKATFDEGLKLCTNAGGTLVLPRTSYENQALFEMIAIMGSHPIFLGVTDRVKEGHFVDMNGSPLTYKNWVANEPNDYKGNEDCVIIVADAKWNDVNCGSNFNIVCEIG